MKRHRFIRFGTYGFLSALLAVQLGVAPDLHAAVNGERAKVDAKKSARSVKRDLKKTGRKITGQDNAWDDAKDEARDAGKNIKDETDYHAKKLQKKAR